MNHNMFGLLYTTFQSFPLALLQAAALIGILATLLMLKGNKVFSESNSVLLGIVLGLSNAFFTLVITGWITLGLNALLITDFLFLAGFLGGRGNAIWAVIFAVLGHLIVVSAQNILYVLFDFMCIAGGGVLLRQHFIRREVNYLKWPTSIKLVLWRFTIVILPVLLLYFVPAAHEFSNVLLRQRIVGSFSFSVIILASVILLLRNERERENQMFIEPNSGLPNHRALQQYMEDVAPQSRKELRTLLIIDVPNARDLLQEHGHAWVDSFTSRLGSALTEIAAESWLTPYQPGLYCLSERSCAILLHGVTLQHVARRNLATRVYNALSENKFCQQGALSPWFTLSVFAVLPFHLKESTRFLRALAFVERTTEGAVQYFAASIVHQVQRENIVRQEIDRCIRTENAPLWLQPKICLATGRCIGAEALLRMQTGSSRRSFPPPQIFSIAARHHLLEKLEWAIIQTVVFYLESLPSRFSDLAISVNLSPTTLGKPGFGQQVCDLLKSRGIPGSRLLVEIIETSRLSVTEPVVAKNTTAMSGYGIRLSLDDFGTGYSSIYLLSQLSFYELKIDYSMVSSMEDPRVRAAILLSVESARQYNAVVTAEGIESPAQQKQLMEMGIQFGQGYLFEKAIPLEDFISYAEEHAAAEAQAS